MLRSRKTRKNYRKGAKVGRVLKLLGHLLFCFKLAGGIAAVLAMTAVFILIYDALTQCDYFRARSLKIEGLQRLTEEDIVKQARVQKGENILAVNLALVRKRLLAHPWIAEAEVSREIPSGLSIRIKEHTPLAVVDVGQKFLMNRRGEIFKEWEPSDPADLPVISGLDVSELRVHAEAEPADDGREGDLKAPFNAVMQVLQLGGQTGSILPNRIIKRIRVDRQIGLTLYAFDQVKMINLGYNDYAGKYQLLENLFSYLKRQRGILDFDRVDLNNLNRIVLNPITIESRHEGS